MEKLEPRTNRLQLRLEGLHKFVTVVST
ncbi:hypothetical protein Taro_030795, partial [Colocasia esculenta]|nr:hypothetical protein [Colocasia esculenta]